MPRNNICNIFTVRFLTFERNENRMTIPNIPPMSPTAIQHQIEAIQRITAEALKSKESAKKILVDAGIMKDESKKDAKKKK